MGKILSSKDIGWRLRKLRLQAGRTQEALAEQIGVTPQQIQNYESGSNKLNTDRLQQLSQALAVPVQCFFTEADEKLPVTVSEQLLLDAYRAIPDREVQNSILKVATIATRKTE